MSQVLDVIQNQETQELPEWPNKSLGRSEIQLHSEGTHTMYLISYALVIAMTAYPLELCREK